MNLINFTDLSNNVGSSYQGDFNDVFTTINEVAKTKSLNTVLDEEKNMDNKQFIENFKFLLQNNDIELIDVLVRAGVPEDKIQHILSSLSKLDENEVDVKGGNAMKGESVQIGDKFVEIINSGDGVTNNYANLLDNIGLVKELKTKVVDLNRLLKDKDDLIAAQKETIELLRKQINS